MKSWMKWALICLIVAAALLPVTALAMDKQVYISVYAEEGGSVSTLCPICGYCEEMDNLIAVKDARAAGKTPNGKLLVFAAKAGSDHMLLTVAFEKNGQLVMPAGEITLTLPAAQLNGYDLALIGPDGEETPVDHEVKGDEITITLRFAQAEQPALVFALIPQG